MQRLQKILAAAGLGSRRACEEIIQQGRVSVNGKQAHLGQSADPEKDIITVDGARLSITQEHTYIAVYKPTNIICTLSDELGRKTVRDLVSVEGKLVPAGRLDADSEGLVLLTDDGELTNKLTHPRYEHEKEYHVYVSGRPTQTTLARWRRGVELPNMDERTHDGGRTAPAQVEIMQVERDAYLDDTGTWLRVVMHEGRKRQIRRVARLLGHPVHKLIRVRIGPLHLGNLRPGQWKRLTGSEIAALKLEVGNRKPEVSGRKSQPGNRKQKDRKSQKRSRPI